MNGWEQRARKLDARKRRMQKHGRSLLSAVAAAERRRARRVSPQDGHPIRREPPPPS